MNTDSNLMARPSPQQEADAALQAITARSMAENLVAIAEMSDGADEAHVSAHIRGMVTATLDHLSAVAPAITRHNAEQWQEWALGIADGVTQTVQAGV